MRFSCSNEYFKILFSLKLLFKIFIDDTADVAFNNGYQEIRFINSEVQQKPSEKKK